MAEYVRSEVAKVTERSRKSAIPIPKDAAQFSLGREDRIEIERLSCIHQVNVVSCTTVLGCFVPTSPLVLVSYFLTISQWSPRFRGFDTWQTSEAIIQSSRSGVGVNFIFDKKNKTLNPENSLFPRVFGQVISKSMR